MKAKVEKLVREPCELEITGATLLTVDEARNLLTVEDRACGSWWWLRSPGDCQISAVNINEAGSVYAIGDNVYNDSVGVRYALRIANLESSDLKIGDKFCYGQKYFKVISEHLALCEAVIGLTN